MGLAALEAAIAEEVQRSHRRILAGALLVMHQRHLSGVANCPCEYCEQLWSYVESKILYKRFKARYERGDHDITAVLFEKVKQRYQEKLRVHRFMSMFPFKSRKMDSDMVAQIENDPMASYLITQFGTG